MSIKKCIFFAGMAALGLNAYANEVGYHSGRLTTAAAQWWKAHGVDQIELYASHPRFNESRTDAAKAAWDDMKAVRLNTPVYGKINDEAVALVREAGGQIKYEVEGFVLGKLAKVGPLLDELRARKLDAIADRITAYIANIKVRGPQIKTSEDWAAFLADHNLPVDMQLHFDHYLSNFDFEKTLTPQIIKEINTTMIMDKDNKAVSLADECVRWLAKAVFKPGRVLTDVVNMNAIPGHQVPSIILHDAEGDDKDVELIVTRHHQKMGTKVTVGVMLPEGAEFDAIEAHYNGLNSENVKYEVFRDSESENQKALVDVWKLKK